MGLLPDVGGLEWLMVMHEVLGLRYTRIQVGMLVRQGRNLPDWGP